ncbi:MAG: cation diffusion facilitator family transporter [Chitinivibrionales bacterium]
MNKQNAAILSILSNAFLIIFKIVAGVLMGSISVISEAAHSGIDLIASMVAFFSIKLAVEPADTKHPYGHGKFENISGFFEAMLIFFAAAMIVFEAVKKLFHPVDVEKLDWGIAVMLVSAIVNIVISRMLMQTSKRAGSIALEADAANHTVDVFTSLSVMAGLIVIRFTRIEILDPIIGIAVAIMICKTSIDLTKRSIKDLLDERLPDDEEKTIHRVLDSYPDVISYHKLRTRRSGNQREIDIHITMEKNASLEKVHELCDTIEREINMALPGTTITIHAEPQSAMGA